MNPRSFQPLLDGTDIWNWVRLTERADDDSVRNAIAGRVDGIERMALLLSDRAREHHLEELAHRSHTLTVQRFGRVLQMYAPLYLSNECIDSCTYCGFSREHAVKRVTLDVEHAAREAALVREMGFAHLLLVTGEHPRIVDTGYLASVVRRLRGEFASIAIEVAPQYEEGYAQLAEAGVDALTVYQETYDRDVYAKVHLAGRKKNFDWRLETAERAARAGIKRINIGALFGLANWRYDALATYLHAAWMQRVLWRVQVSVSMPRLQDAIGAIDAPQPMNDHELVQLVCAMRLCLPDVGLVLSTRESEAMRNGVLPLGITQLSAGSHTEPGGYANPDPQAEQFVVADHRSASDVAGYLKSRGYEVVWKDWEPTLHGSLSKEVEA